MYASEQFSMNACIYVLRMCVYAHIYVGRRSGSGKDLCMYVS